MRHLRNAKKKRVATWPVSAPPPADLAQRVNYVGSAEHKSYPSSAGPPKLRYNDASSCDPKYTNFEAPTNALRQAVGRMCTSDFVGEFPKYVWGELDGKLYEARLVNHEQGWYKGYPLSAREELPEDPNGLLAGTLDG